jgi:hypothetical protein
MGLSVIVLDTIFFEYVEEPGLHPWRSISLIHAPETCL